MIENLGKLLLKKYNYTLDNYKVINEEIRLLYVALTRSRNNLTLFIPIPMEQTIKTWSGVLSKGEVNEHTDYNS